MTICPKWSWSVHYKYILLTITQNGLRIITTEINKNTTTNNWTNKFPIVFYKLRSLSRPIVKWLATRDINSLYGARITKPISMLIHDCFDTCGRQWYNGYTNATVCYLTNCAKVYCLKSVIWYLWNMWFLLLRMLCITGNSFHFFN